MPACQLTPAGRHPPSPLRRLPAGLGDKLRGYETVKDFVMSLQKPRCGRAGLRPSWACPVVVGWASVTPS